MNSCTHEVGHESDELSTTPKQKNLGHYETNEMTWKKKKIS